MNVAYKEIGTIEITKKDYITERFEAFGGPIDKVANTPGKNHLF